MGVFVDLTKQKDQEQMMEEIRGKTLEKAQQVIIIKCWLLRKLPVF